MDCLWIVPHDTSMDYRLQLKSSLPKQGYNMDTATSATRALVQKANPMGDRENVGEGNKA